MKTISRASIAPTRPTHITVRERLQRLAALDLSRINAKVRREHGWTEEQANEAEMWYKRLLTCIIRFPKRAKYVPNAPIDEFWHSHICDTRAYGTDCQHVIGHFVHHNPYYGVQSPRDLANNRRSFKATNRIYRELFGEDCTQMQHFDGHGGLLNCDTGITCNGQ